MSSKIKGRQFGAINKRHEYQNPAFDLEDITKGAGLSTHAGTKPPKKKPLDFEVEDNVRINSNRSK